MGRLTFKIHYGTRWGENLFLELPPLDSTPHSHAVRHAMHHVGNGSWTLDLPTTQPSANLEYRYVFEGPDGDVRREPLPRRVPILDQDQAMLDQWLEAASPDAVFPRQAFAGIIFQPSHAAVARLDLQSRRVLHLTLRAPRVPAGHRVCVSGNHDRFGHWDPTRALVLSGDHYPVWETDLPLDEFNQAIEFKFGLWNDAEERVVHLEAGASRWLRDLPADRQVVIVQAEHYRHETPWKGAGVAIPVFALRSERGYGVGEFADLGPFAEWAAACGLHLVQVLPVNDTSSDFSWKDSYPYKAISSAALHPIYLNVQSLFEEYGQPLPAGYLEKRAALNRLSQVDYETVLSDKLAYLRQFYAAVGPQTLRSPSFSAFFREQTRWIKPYAAFCRLRDLHGTADFSQWGEWAAFRGAAIRPWFKPGAPEHDEVMFHIFLQFHLKQQLDHALALGHACGVAFKGDLPIGIDRCSVEAWTQPRLFHMDRQTGAPPDPFSSLGQNWGFPTYHWPRMEADGFAWWRQRFHRMSACFDALRIDHILGFFRIWEIPGGQTEGILGHFNPTLPLSREDIRRFGFKPDPRQFLQPSTSEAGLTRLFGQETGKVAAHLFVRAADGLFRLRPEWADRASRRVWHIRACTVDEANRIEAGLARFAYEVLFLEDPDHRTRYHPRINLHETDLFAALSEDDQAALRKLHDDFFHRRHTRFWEAEAMKKLPALMDATDMLICGEDLGMIPDSVPIVLQRLGLFSLEIQRMPKRLGQRFADPRDYPYLSVCTTSTHDLPTIRGHWEEDEAAREAFWHEVLKREGQPPAEASPDICRFILQQNLAAPSMWCILPLQDWLAFDPGLRHPDAASERINIPAIARHYWRYRMHLTVEKLRQAEGFSRNVAKLVGDAGRNPRL